ncbi:MAG: ABC transporter ATP-binding protein [Leptospiraceae bacterium]|nr:ABC transporter ATP-binding protein [Leptospiraceae bacterium]
MLLVVKNLSKTYREGETELPVIKSLSFSMAKGDFVSIRGASGAGKSTFLNLIGALDSFDEGDIIIDGISLKNYAHKEELTLFRRDKIGFVFQNHYLMAEFTVLENVMFPLLLQKVPRRQARERAELMLERVGLKDRRNHYPSQISGGESQRAAVARALVHKPVLVLADEPTGNLDATNRKKFIELLQNLQLQENLSILVVTHEEDLARCAKRQYLMVDGKLELLSG